MRHPWDTSDRPPLADRDCRTCGRKIGSDCPARGRGEEAAELRRQRKVHGFCARWELIYDPECT